MVMIRKFVHVATVRENKDYKSNIARSQVHSPAGEGS